MIGPVQWARKGDANIAYRIVGEGPVDLVFLGGVISHVEVMLEEPGVRRWFERLGSIARTILVDRRGAGLSDPMPDDWSPASEAADLLAVLDAAGLERVVLFSYAAATASALEFAAEHPDRVLALILYSPVLRALPEDASRLGAGPGNERFSDEMMRSWGDGTNLGAMAPSVGRWARIEAWLGRMERQSMTPSGLKRMLTGLQGVDSAAALAQIQAPALVLYREGDRFFDKAHAEETAAGIADSRLVVLPGVDSLPMVGETEPMLAEIEEFLTGKRSGAEAERELLTIVITDVVEATTRLARIGDAHWRDLLAAHDEAIRREVDRFGGRVIKTAGDSFVIAFGALPSLAVESALEMVKAAKALSVDIRVGVHTGECELIGSDVGGIAVHIASRINDVSAAGEVLVSASTYFAAVGSGVVFEDRGPYELKGVPFSLPLFAASR